MKEIKEIIKKAININRWADKSNTTYPFLDEEEIKEMAENVINQLKDKGYKIIKK
tara:strand:+ start:47 stop:211 length:165 start_codon:yes stop_codon:yes gene_type:complete